jgi:hypothetical protein
MIGMARQLSFFEATRSWRLDEETRAVGRKGLAEARAALAAARKPVPVRRRAIPPSPARRPAA